MTLKIELSILRAGFRPLKLVVAVTAALDHLLMSLQTLCHWNCSRSKFHAENH